MRTPGVPSAGLFPICPLFRWQWWGSVARDGPSSDSGSLNPSPSSFWGIVVCTPRDVWVLVWMTVRHPHCHALPPLFLKFPSQKHTACPCPLHPSAPRAHPQPPMFPRPTAYDSVCCCFIGERRFCFFFFSEPGQPVFLAPWAVSSNPPCSLPVPSVAEASCPNPRALGRCRSGSKHQHRKYSTHS